MRPGLLLCLGAAAELDNAPPVALAGPMHGQGRVLLHGFALLRNAQTRFTAAMPVMRPIRQ